MNNYILTDIDRRILLKGVYNLRHLGGYATSSGQATRPGQAFRSDSLHQLSPDTQEEFLALGIRTIIDLRSPAEVAEHPSVFDGSGSVRYRHMPLYDDWLELGYDNGGPRDQQDHYRHILDHCHQTLGGVLAAAAEADAFPILIHCQVGKDRTGLVIALMLALADVPTQTIVHDYALSADYLRPLLVKLRQKWNEDGHDMSHMEKFLHSPPDDLQSALDYIEESHGSMDAYFQVLGLSAAQKESIRSQMIG